MGSSAVRTLAGISEVDEVVIGDINVERAREIAEEIGEKVSAEKVDIRKHEELVRILRGFDVVLNCVGPFYEWAEPVIRGAMDAGSNYVDICDDHDPTERMMQMDEEVKKAGILALIGCGWTPGLSNILARYGAEKLGVSDEIRISWVGGSRRQHGLRRSEARISRPNRESPTIHRRGACPCGCRLGYGACPLPRTHRGCWSPVLRAPRTTNHTKIHRGRENLHT